MKPHNLAIFDSKEELGPIVVPAFKKLGFNVICINPMGSYQDRGCLPANINVYDCAIDAMYSANPNERSQFSFHLGELTDIIIPPSKENDSSTAKFFNGGTRQAYGIIKVYQMLTKPEMATPAQQLKIMSDLNHAREIIKLASSYRSGDYSDPIVNGLRREAATLLEVTKDTPKYLPQFLTGALEKLKCFDESGRLATMGEFAVTRISDLRNQEKTILINMTPLKMLESYRVFNSLVLHNIFAACMENQNGIHVHAILEEFLALNVPNLNTRLNTMRGMNFSAEFYLQSWAGLVNRYDKDTAEEIMANIDIWHYMATNSEEEAKSVSASAGEHTVRRSSASVNQNDFTEFSQTFQDTTEKIITPSQVKSLDQNKQIIFVRGMSPIIGEKVRYWEIEGVRELLGENPQEGPAPKVPAKVKIKITKDGVFYKKPRINKRNYFAELFNFLRPILKLQYYIWLYLWIAIIGAFQFVPNMTDVPAVLWSYEYRESYGRRTYVSCTYFTLLGERYTTFIPNCPFLLLRELER